MAKYGKKTGPSILQRVVVHLCIPYQVFWLRIPQSWQVIGGDRDGWLGAGRDSVSGGKLGADGDAGLGEGVEQ